MNSVDTQTPSQDPWDVALLGGAAASMYRTPTPPPAAKPISQDVTKLLKETPQATSVPETPKQTPKNEMTEPAKIIPAMVTMPGPNTAPKTIIPPIIKAPVRPLAPIAPSPLKVPDILASVPKKAIPASPTAPMPSEAVVPTPPSRTSKTTVEISRPRPSLPPAYPVASPLKSLALHLLVMALGVPLFAGGFYLADYTKSYLGKPSSAQVSESREVRTATSTTPR